MKISTLIWCARAARLEAAAARDTYNMVKRQKWTAEELDRLWEIVRRRERQQNLFEWEAYKRAEDLGV
jgi:hypothetical protein